MAGAVLLPLRENLRDEPQDDFPLSYYPMFTANRGRYTIVNYFVGVDYDGGKRTLPVALTGTGGLNQVRRQINRAVREGRADEICAALARTVAASRTPELRDVESVLLVRGSYRLKRYFAGDTEPRREVVVASCAVERGDR